MDGLRILYLFSTGLMVALSVRTLFLLRKTRKLTDDSTKLLDWLKKQPDVVPCYECRFYLENEPFCPKSGMKMKDGLIFCGYGERKEVSDEGNADDNGCR